MPKSSSKSTSKTSNSHDPKPRAVSPTVGGNGYTVPSSTELGFIGGNSEMNKEGGHVDGDAVIGEEEQEEEAYDFSPIRGSDSGSGAGYRPGAPQPPHRQQQLQPHQHTSNARGSSSSPSSSSHAYGLGPTLVVLDDPARRYLQPPHPGSNLPYPPPLTTTASQSLSSDPSQPQPQPNPLIPTPLPVSLPRLPPIPPLIVHQEQLYFDDGLGAPGRCPHDRKWGRVSSVNGGESSGGGSGAGGAAGHRPERGLKLTDVEMDDFMVDLGDLVSKEYDAWIERCWVEAFHYTYTVSIPALIVGLIQSSPSTTFLRRKIVHGGPHIDALLAQQFRHMMYEEHERRMSDEDGSRRGVDLGNLLAGLVPVAPQSSVGAAGWGSMTGGGAAAGDGSASNRLAVNGSSEVERREQMPLSATSGRLLSQAHSGAGQMPISPNLSVGPPVMAPGQLTPTTLQYLQHLPDPARTGYGNGVCFHDLALLHGRRADDHGPCMCDLTACRTCFHELLYFRGRREPYPPATGGPNGLLYHPGRHGETENPEGYGQAQHQYHPAQQQQQQQPQHHQHHQQPHNMQQQPMSGQQPHIKRPSPLQIKHPEMADILLVEEHLRTRLHYMGSPDVVLRYGDEDEFTPLVEDILKIDDEASREENAVESVTGGKGAMGGTNRKPIQRIIAGKRGRGGKVLKGGVLPKLIVNGAAKREGDASSEGEVTDGDRVKESGERKLNGSQLPKSWTDEPATDRNMAVILTYRHLIKLLHVTALYLSPFEFEDYADDCAVLTEIHPLAVYRRLVEPYIRRRAAAYDQSRADASDADEISENRSSAKGSGNVDVTAWKSCMDQWEKEVAIREKEGGNAILKTQPARAVAFYTQAICLDSENPVYYLNRAAAFNAIENYEDAEIDCSRALSLNKSHMKAWYRRAVARKGMGRLDEAEQDLLHLLNQAPNIAAASAELASIRKEIEEMKKREAVDDLD